MDARPMTNAHHLRRSGQALIEMIFILPLIITLMIWLMQGVEVVRASAEHQKYLRLNLFMRMNNYAKTTVDALGSGISARPAPQPHERNFMSLEYSPELGQKRLATSLDDFQRRQGSPVFVKSKLGICVRPDC